MKKIFVLLTSLLVFPLAGNAGGGPSLGNIVYDPTNHAENLVTAAQSVLSEMHLADQYVLQAQQYLTQIKQLEGLTQGELLANLKETQGDINTYKNYEAALETLYGSLNDANRRFRDRAMIADDEHLPWKDYYEREKALNNAAFDTDTAMLKHIDSNYERVQRIQKQIPRSSGIHQSMQTMNQYMDVVVGQNAMTQQLLAAQVRQQTEATKAKNENDEDVRALIERIKQADAKTREQAKRGVEALSKEEDITLKRIKK